MALMFAMIYRLVEVYRTAGRNSDRGRFKRTGSRETSTGSSSARKTATNRL